MIKVSIIVPVYNIAEYLPKCVDSILNQSLMEIEIILVDDGSTDESGEICDRYESQDDRVRVIHKENEGLAEARNAGIAKAAGAYLGFVDGDDYIKPEMFEILYRACEEKGTKMAACDYAFEEGGKGRSVSCNTGECRKLTAEEFFLRVLKTPSAVGMGVWNKLYRRELFCQTLFRTGSFHEDTDILYRLVFQTEAVSYISSPYYIHRDRKGSITKQSYGRRDRDRYAANSRMFRYIKENHPKLLQAAADNRCRSMTGIVNNMVDSRVYDQKMYRKIRREVRKLLPELYGEEGLSLKLLLKLVLISLGYFPYEVARRTFRFL